jgi:FAD/FMN-containing dehydrogenase
VTIDLSSLKEVMIHKSQNFVSVGPGNTWGEVYNRIEPEGLAVSGSYWGNTGVGGMLLGGE